MHDHLPSSWQLISKISSFFVKFGSFGLEKILESLRDLFFKIEEFSIQNFL